MNNRNSYVGIECFVVKNIFFNMEVNEIKYGREFSIYEAREKWKNKNKEKE